VTKELTTTNTIVMKPLLLLLFFSLSSGLFSQSQNAEIVQSKSPQTKSEKMLGSWYMYHGNHQISERYSLISGFQLRTYETVNNHNLSFGYFGVARSLKNNVSVALKYGYLEIDRSIEFTDQPNAIEHRLMEHLTHKFTLKDHKVLQRLQLEHRFIHFVDTNTTQHRLRYRLGYQYGLSSLLTFDINNEFFFHHDRKSYRENRFYAGFNVKTSSHTKLKVGYMKQFINEQYLDRLQIGLILTTNFR
jgi:hypothetical protein